MPPFSPPGLFPRPSSSALNLLYSILLSVFFFVAGPSYATENFHDCLGQLRELAAKAEIPTETFDNLTGHLSADAETLARLDRQPELTTPIDQYLQQLVSDARIRQGQQKLIEHQELLAQIETVYGVDPAIVVAIWGLESSYGSNSGRFEILRSLATLSCFGRRQDFFRSEFNSALRILQRGDIPAEQFYGSWAGAFGQTQFLPSSFERTAVDFSGDGRRDIINNVADALASAAHYLQQAGWQADQPWGFEVTAPAAAIPAGASRRDHKPLSFWAAQGFVRVDGSPLITAPLTDTAQAGLLLPAGSDGPRFLVLPNFEALFRYNPAESYALAVGLLADRLRGEGGIVTEWPKN